jgi:flagellar secretion chaperone FliS
MMYKTHSNTYQEVAVQTSSPTKLVVMLYEGAVRFLNESIAAIQANDRERKRHSVDRAVAIVQHLQSTLDIERGGIVAAELNRLYGYITTRILEGSTKLETAPLGEAIKLLNVLLAAWEELAKKETHNAVRPALQARQTANGGFELHA